MIRTTMLTSFIVVTAWLVTSCKAGEQYSETTTYLGPTYSVKIQNPSSPGVLAPSIEDLKKGNGCRITASLKAVRVFQSSTEKNLKYIVLFANLDGCERSHGFVDQTKVAISGLDTAKGYALTAINSAHVEPMFGFVSKSENRNCLVVPGDVLLVEDNPKEIDAQTLHVKVFSKSASCRAGYGFIKKSNFDLSGVQVDK